MQFVELALLQTQDPRYYMYGIEFFIYIYFFFYIVMSSA